MSAYTLEPVCQVGTGFYYRVRVDADTLQCDVRKLPYPTWLGTIHPSFDDASRRPRSELYAIRAWTPAASIPRGFARARDAVLQAARDEVCGKDTDSLACKLQRRAAAAYHFARVASENGLPAGIVADLQSQAAQWARYMERARHVESR